jgi:hypothetical protein
MAKATDLQSLGMGGSALAALVGFSPVAVTAAGTAVGTATLIPQNGTWANVTTSSSNTGVRLPAGSGTNPVSQYTAYVVSMTGGQTGIVYPPSGATINGTTSLNVSDNTAVACYQTSATTWVSL